MFLEIKEIPGHRTGFLEVDVFKNLYSYVRLKIGCYSINKLTLAQKGLKRKRNSFYKIDYAEIFRPEMGKVVDAQCRLSMENMKPCIKDFAKSGWLPW